MTLLDDKRLADELGKNARQVALEQYNWDNLIVSLESFYYKIIEANNAQALLSS